MAVQIMEKIRSIVPIKVFIPWERWAWLGLLITFSLVFHTWTLMRYPPPFVDEAWFASRGWSIIHNGINFSSLDAGVIERYEGYWTFFPWLPSWLLSLSLRPFTQPQLFPVRMVSLAFGMVLLLATYIIGNRFRGHRVGLLSGLLLSLSIPFLISAHIGRPDIYVSALGYSAIALTISERWRGVWKDIAAGILIGLAFEMHPNASIFIPPVIAGYILESKTRLLWNKSFWGFCLGVSLGLLYYVNLHILPYPSAYIGINKILFISTHTPPILSLGEVFLSIKTFFEALYQYDLVSIPIIISIIFSFFLGKSQNKKRLNFLGFILISSFILLIRNKNSYYLILYAPIIYIILADFLVTLLANVRNRVDKIIRYLLVSTFLILNILMFTQLLVNYSQGENDFKNLLSKISQEVQPGDKVLANQIYWFGLHDHIIYSWEQLLYFNRVDSTVTIQDGMRELRPDIFILDNWIERALSDTVPDSSYGLYYRLPRNQMYTFLAEHARLIKEFDDEISGPIRIYRIEWPD
jgi:4-amino-4-deoxy-L-arabinose transferase-like glycosyltransferase